MHMKRNCCRHSLRGNVRFKGVSMGNWDDTREAYYGAEINHATGEGGFSGRPENMEKKRGEHVETCTGT